MQLPHSLGIIHIIGIGGVGMSAIAELLHAKNFQVQGSDQRDSSNVQRLRAQGIDVFIGHASQNLKKARYVVISSAIKEINPELKAARNLGLAIISRAEILAELMRLYTTISVTGTHGKTTTTSLIAHIFSTFAMDPSVITGGIINDWNSNARLGQGPWMIVEADESDGTFIKIPTQIGVLTNIDPEHLDYFGTTSNMHSQYAMFMQQIPFYGLIVACIDQKIISDMISHMRLRYNGRRLISYGCTPSADIVLKDIEIISNQTIFSADFGERMPGGARSIDRWMVPIPGTHNALNALAAIAVASEADIPDEHIRMALSSFSGIKRRFQLISSAHGVSIYDDYAHHPIEIKAVLAAAREGTKGRIFAVVEPHRYSRIRDLFQDFCKCLNNADRVFVIPLYTAGEQPIEGITSASLVMGILANGHSSVTSVEHINELASLLRDETHEGDMIIFLGAGQSTTWAHKLSNLMVERQS
ncbi:MAG: UDP-N-acetylmuramate--L-alanine ligase [Hyphomicrobiaceae bacterium hypho_1]